MAKQRIFSLTLLTFSLLASSWMLSGCDSGSKTTEQTATESADSKNEAETPAVDPPTPSASDKVAESNTKSTSPKGGPKFPPSEANANEGSPTVAEPKKEDPPKEITTLEGRWVLVLFQRGGELPLGLIDVAPETREVTFVDSSPHVGAPITFKTGKVTDDSIQIVFEIHTSEFTFNAALKDNAILGNMMSPNGQADLAALRSSTEESMEHLTPGPQPEGDVLNAVLQEAQQAKSLDPLKKFISTHSQSPMALNSYEVILSLVTSSEDFQSTVDAAAVKQIADDFIADSKPWGERLAQQSMLKVANTLLMVPEYHSAAMQMFDRLLSSLDEDAPAAWRKQAENGQAQGQLKSEDKEQQQKGLAYLRSVHKEEPLNKSITAILAEYAEESKQTDEAMALYAELAALPPTSNEFSQMRQRMMNPAAGGNPLPIEHFVRLFKEKGGTDEEVDEHLLKVYHETIYSAAKPRENANSPKENQQVVLCELLTGAACHPCIAADIALGSLEQVYSHQEMVVLRYHQHIPRPDPLVNEDTEARAFYYGAQSSPTIFINGKQTELMSGLLGEVIPRYEALQEVIEEELALESDIKINLTATAEAGEITINASTDKIEEVDPNLRLRIVIAEDEVQFTAVNGVKLHEMVVRTSVGSPDGILPQDGVFEFSTKIKTDDIRKKIDGYLTGYAKSQFQGQDVFPVRPMKMEKLHVVAFVQLDDKSHPVLQTVSVPVTGSLVAAAAKPAKKPEAKEEPKEEEEKPAPTTTDSKEEKKAETPAPKTEAKKESKPADSADSKPVESKSGSIPAPVPAEDAS